MFDRERENETRGQVFRRVQVKVASAEQTEFRIPQTAPASPFPAPTTGIAPSEHHQSQKLHIA